MEKAPGHRRDGHGHRTAAQVGFEPSRPRLRHVSSWPGRAALAVATNSPACGGRADSLISLKKPPFVTQSGRFALGRQPRGIGSTLSSHYQGREEVLQPWVCDTEVVLIRYDARPPAGWPLDHRLVGVVPTPARVQGCQWKYATSAIYPIASISSCEGYLRYQPFATIYVRLPHYALRLV